MLLKASPRFRLVATSAFLLALMALGAAVTLFNVNTLGVAGWHVELREQMNNRRRCQYSFQLTADDRPDWLEHNIHWSAQNRVRTNNQIRMITTLYVSGQGQSLFVMGVLSTYGTMAHCSP